MMHGRFKKLDQESSWLEPARQLRVVGEADVVVCGGGPAGFGAALSAARNGSKVILIERYGFLGGMATLSMVNLFAIRNLTPYDGEKLPLIGGIPQEFLQRVSALGGAILPDDALKLKESEPVVPSWSDYLLFDVELTKLVMVRMLREAGVTIILHSLVTGAITEDGRVKGVVIESKSGREVVLAERVIDATGDGDVAYLSGADFEHYLGEDTLPVTMIFSIGGADDKRVWEYLLNDPDLGELLKKAPEYIAKPESVFRDIPYPLKIFKARIPWVNERRYDQMIRPGQWWVWGLHLFKRNVVDAAELTECEIVLRERVYETFIFLKNHLPGMENAYLDQTPVQVGIRESRRFHGEYTLTLDDIRSGREFDDGIARGRIKNRPPFHIPYRCLLPKKVDGLLLAGRCISITHEAATQVAPRNQPTCMAIGEAAGAAAALSIKDGVSPRELDVERLKRALVSQGAVLAGK